LSPEQAGFLDLILASRSTGLVGEAETFCNPRPRVATRSEAVGHIAAAHSKSPSQVVLRWHLQEGRAVIPKSSKRDRIAENIDIFGFELSTDELAAIKALDTGKSAAWIWPTSTSTRCSA